MFNRELSVCHSPLRGLEIFAYGWHKQNCVATGWSSDLDSSLASVEEKDCFKWEWDEHSLEGKFLDKQGTVSEKAGILLTVLAR